LSLLAHDDAVLTLTVSRYAADEAWCRRVSPRSVDPGLSQIAALLPPRDALVPAHSPSLSAMTNVRIEVVERQLGGPFRRGK
jgi:hypothetical protein